MSMSDPVKRTIEIVMVIVLFGIGAAVLLLTGESKNQDGNPGYRVDLDTQSVFLGKNSV